MKRERVGYWVEVFRGLALLVLAAGPALGQEVTIEKATNGQDADVPPGPVLLVGAPVNWTYTVTNGTGREVVNIVVTDDQGVVVTCPGTSLGAGESFVCTGNGTAQAGQYANVGTVTAEMLDSTEVSDSDPSHYFGQTVIAVGIEKRTNGFDADVPPGPIVPVGSAVAWTYEVTNLGADPLIEIEVTDDQGVTVLCPETTLEAGESMTCTANGVAQPGQYSNVGMVTALLPNEDTVAAADPSHYFGQTLMLEKATNGMEADLPPGPTILIGGAVLWEYTVSNPGPAAVSGLSVTDDQGVTVSCPQTTLAAGESVTCTGNGVAVEGQYANVGTATVQLPGGAMISATDPSHYFGGTLSLEKATNGVDADLPPGPSILVGSPVAWTYTVTNLGAETLTNVTVTDNQGVTVTCPADTLGSGESMVCTAGGVAVEGQYENIGTVTATSSAPEPIAASDRSHYFGVVPMPAVAATKTAALAVDANGNGAANPGDTLAYTVTIVNAGTGEAAGVVFTDAPDANTALVNGSVTTTAGTVTAGNGAGDASVGVDVGNLAAAGGTATISFRVTIDGPLPAGVTQVANQGTVAGENFEDVMTDDPAAAGASDPTVVTIGAVPVTEIPTAGEWALLAFATLLAGLGVRRI
ncbi:MAG TPA: hypothetical protein VF789_08295 [Thermoanaerobaculia bacterium]